jgi:predicted DNA binding CopG/RHH family protein
MQKPIPEFKSEAEEREFWATHDSTEYLDWSDAESVVFPNLKPSTKTISLRISETMLNELKLLANKMDVPYQSLIKVYLRERIDKDLHGQSVKK